jgi:hypothetical protein
MNEKEVPQSAVVRARRARPRTFSLPNGFAGTVPGDLVDCVPSNSADLKVLRGSTT